jgi:hypothetical protein
MPRTRSQKPIIGKTLFAAAALLAALGIFVFVFSDMLLNRYARDNIEKAFAEAYPDYALHIGSMHYSIVNNAIECLAVSFAAADSTLRCSAGSFSVSEIGWMQLITHRSLQPEVIKRSALTASDIILRLTGQREELRCARIRISIPDSGIVADAVSMTFPRSQYRVRCAIVRASMTTRS